MNIKRFLFKLTRWESWHHHVKYIPIMPVWFLYCIRAKSFWFFTTSNPSITFGGFEGESKREIYEQLPSESYPKSMYVEPSITFSELEKQVTDNGFTYPFIVKPDVGTMGYMFRKISNAGELKKYHEYMLFKYVLQKLIDYPLEVSLFYYRMPNETRGTVSGFLMKLPPQIKGDGESTFLELIENNADLKFKQEEMKQRYQHELDTVLPAGETFILSHASNRSQGGKMVSLEHEIDQKLTTLFDKISLHSKHFYYGRYDIKCASVESLKNGKDFSILEYNGAGAGIQHIYGNGLSLWKACMTILDHWEMLFRISVHNHQKGSPYWKYLTGKKFLKKAMRDLKVLKKLDNGFPAL